MSAATGSVAHTQEQARTAAFVATAEFVLRLRGRGIRNLDVLRALETVPRQNFVPHRYADLAMRDVALPIGCGQTMAEPYVLARMLEALALTPGHRVLEIGAGSGYATAVLARLAGEVLSVDRFQSLAIEAQTRLEALEVRNAAIVWADGLNLPAEAGRFDRILVEALVEDPTPGWLDALSPDGIIVIGKPAAVGAGRRIGQHLVRCARGAEGELVETRIVASRLQPLIPGLSLGL
ncbi:MAG: methyltransferase domain-containing protein [Methylobacteriaceae bacterium]|nr:methyltransferase domain-containing protein [Methylobacteriaceae bacterium]